jgi:hypothetical protein
MIIHVDASTEPARITLLEPADFHGFKVVVAPGADPRTEALAFAQLGPVEGDDHVFVAPEAVAWLAGDAADADWTAGFAGMTGYAASKGWTDDAGRIRAHVEREA